MMSCDVSHHGATTTTAAAVAALTPDAEGSFQTVPEKKNDIYTDHAATAGLLDGHVSCKFSGAQEPSVPANRSGCISNTITRGGDAGDGGARREEALRLYAKAEATVANGLQKCNDWLYARDLFYEAGALFSSCGYPEEAAHSFLHASIIARAFKDEDETYSTLFLAADNLQVTHPAMAVNILDSIAEWFLKAGHVMQTARCRRDIAVLLEERLGDTTKAIEQYTEAVRLFNSRPITKSFARSCMGRITALVVSQMRYAEASKLFEEEASMLPHNVPKSKLYLHALLSLLADGNGGDDRYFDSLYVTRKRFEVLQEEERNFQHGTCNKLMRQLIQANDHGSLNEFDIAVFSYRSSASFVPDPVFDALIERCRANLYEHMEQYM